MSQPDELHAVLGRSHALRDAVGKHGPVCRDSTFRGLKAKHRFACDYRSRAGRRPNSPFVSTDEQISIHQEENLEGIAMHVAECRRLPRNAGDGGTTLQTDDDECSTGTHRSRWRGSARPVPPRHYRKADRYRTRHGAFRRVFNRIAEAKTAAASVAASSTTLRCACIGRGDGIARCISQALGRLINRHVSEFREGHARIERHAVRSVK
ncbi:hypothetical protein [Burkholderia sp. BCC1996]|uniref:hypothetical protein n=1 Tax=unclassified Burkholderia TaxID=2613784 RepID=UPI0039EF2BCA